MSGPLDKDIVPKMNDAYKAYSKLEQSIVDRTNYTIRKIAEIFGGKVEWWDWANGGGEVDGHFDPDFISRESVQLDGSYKGIKKDMDVVLKDGSEWGFEWFEFPTRFLFEDFEDEVAYGIKKYKEVEAEREKKEKEKKDKKQATKKSALQKLTKEERKALGL